MIPLKINSTQSKQPFIGRSLDTSLVAGASLFNHMEEIWKDIKGYEGLYEVSSFGRIKSLARQVIKKEYISFVKEKIRIPHENENGYLTVQLHKDGIKRTVRVNRLVAIAFIPNPENKEEVNHKNGIKRNNYAWNLEWNTSKENTIHAHENKLVKRFTGNPIQRIDSVGNIADYPNVHAAIADGYSKSGINRACNSGKIYKGFFWKYIN